MFCQQAKLHINSFVLKADQDVEIEQGSATLLLLQDYFSQAAHLDKELLAVSPLIKDDGLILISQPASGHTNLTTQIHTTLSHSGFTVLAETTDAEGSDSVLARKLSNTDNTSKSAPLLVTLKGSATNEASQKQLKKAVADASAAGDAASRVWVTAPRHGLDWLDTVLQLNLEYPDAGLR